MSEEKKPESPYMFACQLSPSPDYLSEYEFIRADGSHRELILEIENVAPEDIPVPGTSKVSTVACLSFKGKYKRLAFGTKAKRLAVIELHGRKIPDWVGKSITLYWDPDVKFKGKKTGGIRIKGTKTK